METVENKDAQELLNDQRANVGPRAISLFCGAGGCSLGFKKAGYDIVYAVDNEPSTKVTYEYNFPKTPFVLQDITKIDFHQVLKACNLSPGELEILIGGPPCQGFSTAGMRFWDDPRNQLLKSYVAALKIIQPKWFLMENVEGLLTSAKGKYIYEAVKAFIGAGYTVRVEKVYAQEYGVPQRRKRVIIIGNRFGHAYDMPEPKVHVTGKIFRNSDVTLRHAIQGLPKAQIGRNKELQYEVPAYDLWEVAIRNGAMAVTDHAFPDQSELQLKKILLLKPGQTMKDLPEEFHHESFKKRAFRRVMDGTPSEKRGGAPSGIKRLFFDEPCLTITGAATRELVHPVEHRPLTIREAARIQTFPDSFRFFGNSSQKIQQIGNAIPPLIAQIFAEDIKDNYGFDDPTVQYGKLLPFTLTKASAMSPALQHTQELLNSLLDTDNVQLPLFNIMENM